MKITICSPQYGLSPRSSAGGEVYDDHVLFYLAQQGVQVDILLPHGKRVRQKVPRWTIHRFGPAFIARSYLFNLIMLPELIRTYRKTKFCILRVHSPYYVGIGAWLFKKIWAPHVQLVVTYHHIEHRRFVYHLLDKIFARRWDTIVVPSQATQADLKKRYHVEPHRVHVYMNGVSKDYRPKKNTRSPVNTHEADRVFTLVTCGRLIPRKNTIFLVDLIKELNDSSYRLIVIGEGPERKRLEQHAQRSGVADQIIFTGYCTQQEKVRYFQEAHLFVFPSLQEGFGLVVAEAMACACPVLASDRGALPEVVDDGGVILPLDLGEWVAKIIELRHNPQYRSQLSRKALERSQVFRWDSVAKAMVKLFQTLCASST